MPSRMLRIAAVVVGALLLQAAPADAQAPPVSGRALLRAQLQMTQSPGAPLGQRPADRPRWGVRSAAADSLPDGMPLVTRAFWGKQGFFRAIGLAPSTRRGELQLRRSMLQWHQRMGLLTFGALTTQVVLGELMARDPARYYQDLRPTHRTLGYATFGTYMTTASLSLFAPPARRYGDGFSSVRLHRWLALVHFTGMAALPWLGVRLAEAPGDAYDRRLNQHRWAGRVTLGAYTAALFTIFLPY